MKKLKMHSPDLTQENIAKIRDLFPGCVTEARDQATGMLRLVVDFDQLRQELCSDKVEGPQERYCLNWPGKRDGLLAANISISKTLRPCREDSLNFEFTKNLFIEGDNLEALKLIQETYLGKIKLIYIDPPYNKDGDLIYRDRFATDQRTQEIASGERSTEGAKLVANPEGSGRFHSNWLNMILPRLKLAKNLLTRDGAIFVSCDKGEHPRLRLIMDEIFGQSNFVADLVWAAGRKNDSKLVSISHEYIICYARDVEFLREKKIKWRQRKKGIDDIYKQYDRLTKKHDNDYLAISEGLKSWFDELPNNNPAKAHKHYNCIDHRGIYFPDNISWPGGGGPKYEVLHPKTKKPVKIPSRGWITRDSMKMQEWIEDDRVHFGTNEEAVPCIKSYLKDREFMAPYSVFYQDGRAASKRLRSLMGSNLFEFPKDEFVLQEIVEMLTEKNDIVIDFFAGSSTTAHSVMLQNAVDGANRKFIMVQLDESTSENSIAYKAGFNSISEISRERIRRAGTKILDGEYHPDWNKDVGFRLLKIDSSNMKEVFYRPDDLKQEDLLDSAENLRADRSAEDLLFQVLVDWGVDLTLPIRNATLHGKTVYFVDENALVACFDKDVNEGLLRELASLDPPPLRVVFRDNGFNSDAARINAEQIFRQLSPSTEVRAI